MTTKEKIERASAAVAFDGIYKYIKKNPEENLVKLIDLAQKLMGGAFPEKNFDAFRNAVNDKDNVWRTFALNIINNCDKNVIKNMLLALGLGAGVNGTRPCAQTEKNISATFLFRCFLTPQAPATLIAKAAGLRNTVIRQT